MHSLGINPQLFDYLNNLFITESPYNPKSIENFPPNIISLPMLGLWGVHGLIADYNIQDDLWKKYDHDQLMMVSHLIANHLMVNLLQWVSSYNPIYYYPHQQYFNNYCHYQYHKPLINLKIKKSWQKHAHLKQLKVGQKINGGPIGHYHWKYEASTIKDHVSLDKIQL